MADTTLPLKLAIKISIHEPGGRTTDKQRSARYSHSRRPSLLIEHASRLRWRFGGGKSGRAGFQIIAVDDAGKRIALNGLTWSWTREDTFWQWFQSNGEWRYQSNTHDRLIASGTLDVGAGGTVRLAQQLPYGRYRLTVSDKSGASSSYRFYSGWSASGDNDRPDRIPVAADKPGYSPGSIAHVRIAPDANGKARWWPGGGRPALFSSRLIDAPASGATSGHSGLGRLGGRRLCAGDALPPAVASVGREGRCAASASPGLAQVDNGPRTLSVAHRSPRPTRRGRANG